jgi:tetratricopeptide (TPR) repeat protein
MPWAVGLACVLSCATGWAAPVQERWVEARSTHFTVLTDAGEKQAARLVSHFERMRIVFHSLLPTEVDDAGPPILVLAVKDRQGMQAVEPAAYLAKGQMDLAGFFVRAPEKNYILLRLDAEQDHAFSTVYHEYTHYMLRKQAALIPLWLNEGLAQFYENTDMDEKTAYLGQASSDGLRLLKQRDPIPLETLLRVNAASPYYHEEEKGSIFYAESWALTHMLMVSDRIQGTHRVRDYFALLMQGEDAVAAARKVFGDLGRLQKTLDDYVIQRKFMYFMMPAVLGPKDGRVDLWAVTSSDADAVRADLMVYTGRTQDAMELDQAVLRADPGNGLAHETMGYLRFSAGEMEAARQWFGRASAIDPKSYLAWYYGAVTTMRTGNVGEDGAIEADLRQAIALNADFAPAYDALATFYGSRRRNLADAHGLAATAIRLEPGRLSYRLNCAEVLTQQRQYVDALGVLQVAMRMARTRGEMDAVRDRVARVERSQMAMLGAVRGMGR